MCTRGTMFIHYTCCIVHAQQSGVHQCVKGSSGCRHKSTRTAIDQLSCLPSHSHCCSIGDTATVHVRQRSHTLITLRLLAAGRASDISEITVTQLIKQSQSTEHSQHTQITHCRIASLDTIAMREPAYAPSVGTFASYYCSRLLRGLGHNLAVKLACVLLMVALAHSE